VAIGVVRCGRPVDFGPEVLVTVTGRVRGGAAPGSAVAQANGTVRSLASIPKEF
jgi:hypothetical protein